MRQSSVTEHITIVDSKGEAQDIDIRQDRARMENHQNFGGIDWAFESVPTASATTACEKTEAMEQI